MTDYDRLFEAYGKTCLNVDDLYRQWQEAINAREALVVLLCDYGKQKPMEAKE